MKKHDLFDSIGNVDDKYLEECEKEQVEATYKPAGILKTVSVAAVFVLIFGVVAILPRLLFGTPSPVGPVVSDTKIDTTETEPPTDEPIYDDVPPPVEVIDAYGEATRAANWFRLTQYGMNIDNNDSVTIDGIPYYRVTDYESYADFIAYLHTLFSEEVTAQLLESTIMFKEYDSKLYLAPADGGSNICIGGESLFYKVVNDKRIELTARVDINDVADRTDPDPKGEVIGTVDVVFPYELIGDKWVFTDFPDTDAINTDSFIGTALKTKPELYNYYECGGMTLVLPKKYELNYSVLMNSPEALNALKLNEELGDAVTLDNNMLFEVFFRRPDGVNDGEHYTERFHQIFRIVRYTPGEYERNVLGSIVARREVLGYDGEYYYVMWHPTDAVVVPDEDASVYYSTVNSCEEAARMLFGKYNGLEAASPTDFYQRTYTYDSDHIYYRYYPYGTENEEKHGTYYTFVLSQPADKGADGIWCVERWYTSPGADGRGYIMPVFPDSGDLSAKEFYENLQRKVSAGQTAVLVKYLDPLCVAVTAAREVIGHSFAEASYFIEVDGLPDGEWTY